jgi:hypothetical protein
LEKALDGPAANPRLCFTNGIQNAKFRNSVVYLTEIIISVLPEIEVGNPFHLFEARIPGDYRSD